MHTIFIALGSNIDPEKNLREATKLLRDAFPKIQFSSVYQSKASEVEDQPDFLNAVAEVETDRKPEEVKEALEVIEHALKKAPPYRFGPRTIDLDLLLYDDLTIDSPALMIPHPKMHRRRFVLEPLCELSDDPRWKSLLAEILDQPCERTEIRL